MKVYISGRITGNPHYMQDFERAEQFLSCALVEVVNPCKVSPFDENKTWRDYMRDDLKALVDCSGVYMLRGWWRSKGARLERHVAKKLGLEVVYETRRR